MIPERGVSYYGVAYPDRAARDYAEMVDHGCNAVLLAVSEFDWWFWRKNVVRLIDVAKDHGLTAYVDLWGWGKTLAGEPPSLFLMRSLDGRQRAASGKTYHAMCLNYAPFREHLRSSVTEVITETSVDGLFWDEPHYANWHDPDWACTCPICGALYRDIHGEDIPRELTPEVVEFREDRAVEAGLHMLSTLMRLQGDRFRFNEPTYDERRHFDLLAGTDRLRLSLGEGVPVEEIVGAWEPGLERFMKVRERHLLYGE